MTITRASRPTQRRSSLEKFYEAIPSSTELDRRCNVAGKNIAGKMPKAYENMVFRDPGLFLDWKYPGWRKYVHLWPPRADGMNRVVILYGGSRNEKEEKVCHA